jgi:hypothetical protein
MEPVTVRGIAVASVDAPRVSDKDSGMDDPDAAAPNCTVAIAKTPSVIVLVLIPLKTQVVEPDVG